LSWSRLFEGAWEKRKSGTRDARRDLGAMGNTLERRRKLRRGSAVCIGCNNPAAVRIHCWSKALKARKARDAGSNDGVCGDRAPGCGVYSAMCGKTPGGQFSGDEPEDLAVRENPWRANPMGVTGMKQGRTSERGVNRREGEKP